MKKVIDFFRGTITAVIVGAEPEVILNLCAKAGILFWEVKRRDAFTLTIQVTGRSFPKLCSLAGKAQCTVTAEKRAGLPYFLFRFRKRYALLAGCILCLGVVCALSRFVWVIDVVGNERVSTAEILSELRYNGVTVGTYGPSIPKRELAHKMLLSMEELSFFSLNLHGTRAEVIVREKEPKPELVEESIPTDVRATATGIITHMEVRMGDPLFQEGDTVLEGETLITGVIDIKEPEYAPGDLGTSLTHAQGRVMARTWHTMEAEIPCVTQIKERTGQKTVRFSLNLLGKRIKFYGNGGISFSKYDKLTETKTWVLSDGMPLPISLEKETIQAYETREAEIEETAAEEMLREQLLQTLNQGMDEGEVLHADFVTRKEGDCLIVTLMAECSEQIGKMVPIEETRLPNTPDTEERIE